MLDYFSIEETEDDGDGVNCLILDTETGEYGWQYIDRETLAENGREDLAGW